MGGATAVRIVGQRNLAVAEASGISSQDGPHRKRERAELDCDAGSLDYQMTRPIKECRREVELFSDADRVRAPCQDHGHLVCNRAQRVANNFYLEFIDNHVASSFQFRSLHSGRYQDIRSFEAAPRLLCHIPGRSPGPLQGSLTDLLGTLSAWRSIRTPCRRRLAGQR